MNINKKEIIAKKQLIIKKLLNSPKKVIFFKKLDEAFLRSVFANSIELSIMENVPTLKTRNMTTKDVCTCIDLFNTPHQFDYIQTKKQLYDIINISLLQKNKIEKVFKDSRYYLFEKRLLSIINSSILMVIDFLCLKIICNLQQKVSDCLLQKKITNIKKFLLSKLVSFNYQIEKSDNGSTFLCCIDFILTQVNTNQISLGNFITICKKIMQYHCCDLEICWKTYEVVDVLLRQKQFCDNDELRRFKRYVKIAIEQKNASLKINRNNVIKIVIEMLTKNSLTKENYYFSFDCIKILSKNNHEDKLFCFYLLQYLFYQNKRTSLFSHRFGRSYFLKTLFNLLDTKDTREIQIEEFILLANILLKDDFFALQTNDIFERMIVLLNLLGSCNQIIKSNMFYKFCDVLDFFSYLYKTFDLTNLLNFITSKSVSYPAIYKHFQLTTFKNSV